MVTRKTVAEHFARYLRHEIALAQLVDWAENVMMIGDIDETDIDLITEIVGRLGLADVREFVLTWEDCERMLRQLGFETRIEIVPSV